MLSRTTLCQTHRLFENPANCLTASRAIPISSAAVGGVDAQIEVSDAQFELFFLIVPRLRTSTDMP
jgi:hypothetical protein